MARQQRQVAGTAAQELGQWRVYIKSSQDAVFPGSWYYTLIDATQKEETLGQILYLHASRGRDFFVNWVPRPSYSHLGEHTVYYGRGLDNAYNCTARR